MDFNRYAATYEKELDAVLAFSGQSLDFYAQTKAELLLDVVQGEFSDAGAVRALDLGCGVGLTDELIKHRLPGLTGIDVSIDCLKVARQRNPEVSYLSYAGDKLPFADGSFEVVFAICVWHHIPPEKWTLFGREIFRVLASRGIAVIFEHNPWNPLTRRVVSRCVFDENAVLLSHASCARSLRAAGFSRVSVEHFLFFPSAAPILRRFEKSLLKRIPFGAQYMAVAHKSS